MSAGAVPPLPGEDHVCCGLHYGSLSLEDAAAIVAAQGEEVDAALARVPVGRRAQRPAPAVWSAVEYVCHLRDVAMTTTIRLHRVRTEDDPVWEPMLNDLRARRFGYARLDPGAVLAELALAGEGLLAESARIVDPDRTGSRRPGEVRTARWLVRNAAHEGRHHVRDIAAQAR